MPIQVGSAIGQGTTVSEMTDGNANNRVIIENNKLAWFTFSSPKDITSIVLKSNGETKIEFYDNKNNLLLQYNPLVIDGVQTLPTAVSNVSTVVLKPTTYSYIHEWNVFETPSTPPTATTISWIQAGDKTVSLDWKSSAAKSYNVKRSTSSGGPYVVIASNVTTTTFTDKTVNNGIIYYYVISSVNEAGESANSPERGIKPEATQYTGGLLDGVLINLGANISSPMEKVKEATDNNVATRVYIDANKFVWYTFTTPQTINSIVAKTNGETKMEFYDDQHNLLLEYKPLQNDGIQTLPNVVSKVTAVILKPASSGYAYIHEWNAFSTPSTPPLATSISWIYGGDKVVKLEWNITGAKSYNVKRSTSSGGPYSTIATNITGREYTDLKVVNGTTYYYVITAVNEAGESAPSPEKNIKPEATKYTGGLLDSLPISIGSKITSPTGTVKDLTDNNGATRTYIDVNSFAWYSFNSTKEISSVIAKSNGAVVIEFYDNDNNLLLSFKPTKNDEVETLPTPLKNVSLVALKAQIPGYAYGHEWNVFGKNEHQPVPAPLNLTATAGDKSVVLNWSKVNNATAYNVKRSTKAGGPYATVTTVTGNTYSYTDTTVINGTTYYYVVTAVDAISESGNSNEASATPKGGDVVIPPITDDGQSGNRALLRLILNNGIEKEFDLSMKEVNAFIAWYEGRAAGKGSVMFAIDKHNNNKGPFKNRKDYVFYDKIITFEVNGYDSADQPTVPEEKPNGNGSNGNNQPDYEELM